MNLHLTRPRAFALTYFLVVSALVVMLTGTIVILCQRQLFTSRSGVDRNGALYASEAGIADATAQLERDGTWTTGFSKKPLLSGEGHYSMTFASNPSTATAFESINNLQGSMAADSYRGPATVPPRSALLVVTGQFGSMTRTVEVLLVPGADPLAFTGMAATGKVDLRGDVSIDGIESLTDRTPVNASIHSNREGGGLQIEYVPPNPGDSLSVTGNVTSSGSSAVATAIQLAAPSTVAGQASQLPPKRFPRINVDALVADQIGNPGPPLPVSGSASLSNPNNYYAGDVVINGDLTLQADARLYVAGNLTVNGSIRGSGAVVVQGDTRFYGDADIKSTGNQSLSLVSKGHVVLSGFNGQAYLDSLTSGSAIAAEHWSDLQWSLEQVQSYLRTHSNLTPLAMGAQMSTDDAVIDGYQSIISNHGHGLTYTIGGRNRHSNTAGYLKAAVGTGSPVSAQAFLNRRLQQLEDLFRVCYRDRSGGSPRFANANLFDNYALWDPALDGGLFDSLQSHVPIDTAAREQAWRDLKQMVEQYDYSRLGSAQFKGFIYTSGAFVAESDINVLGSVVVNGEPSIGNLTWGNVTYQPGDCIVRGDCRLTYVRQMFEEGVQNLSGVGVLDVKRWVNR
jgi:hypothetical protein